MGSPAVHVAHLQQHCHKLYTTCVQPVLSHPSSILQSESAAYGFHAIVISQRFAATNCAAKDYAQTLPGQPRRPRHQRCFKALEVCYSKLCLLLRETRIVVSGRACTESLCSGLLHYHSMTKLADHSTQPEMKLEMQELHSRCT